MKVAKLFCTTATLGLLAVSMAPAYAQSAAAGVSESEDIVVTARRREERLQDVPVTVTVVGAQAIEERGIANIGDVAALTPGLQFDRGPGPDDLRPSMRGVALIEGRSNVAVLIDGIDVTGMTLDDTFGGGGAQLHTGLMNLARVEVIKGPQSVYFGRSAFAGAISFVSRDPGDQFEAVASGGVGEYGLREFSARIGGPLIESQLWGEVAVMANSFDGFYDNPGGVSKLGDRENFGVSGALILQPNAALRATLRGSYVNAHYGQTPAYPRLRDSSAAGFVQVIDEDLFDASQIGISTNREYPGLNSDIFRTSLNVSYDTGPWTLTSLSGFNFTDATNTFDFDLSGYNTPVGFVSGAYLTCTRSPGGGVPNTCVSVWDYDSTLLQFSQEFRASFDNGGPLRFMLGGYYFLEDYVQTEYNRHIGSSSWVTATRANIVPRDFRQFTRTYSVMGSVEYDISDRITAIAELRYNYETIQGKAPEFVDSTQTGTAGIVFVADETFENINPRFVLNYDVATDHMLYVSAARGSKPGGFNLGLVADHVRAFDQEEIWTYELGYKGALFDGRLTLDLAGYFSDYSGMQISNYCYGSASPLGPEPECPMSAAASLPYIFNAESAEIYGLDASLRFRLGGGFSGSVAYAYTHSEFTDLVTRNPESPLGSTVMTPFSGNSTPNIPEHALLINGRYERELAAGYTGFADVTGSYRSERYTTFVNNTQLAEKTVVDAQIGVQTDHWKVFAFVNNAFDDQTPTSARYGVRINPLATGAMYITAPDRRLIGVRASVNF